MLWLGLGLRQVRRSHRGGEAFGGDFKGFWLWVDRSYFFGCGSGGRSPLRLLDLPGLGSTGGILCALFGEEVVSAREYGEESMGEGLVGRLFGYFLKDLKEG